MLEIAGLTKSFSSAIVAKNNVVSPPFSGLIIKGFASRQPSSTSPPRWPNPVATPPGCRHVAVTPCAFKPPRQFAREQDVAHLGATIRLSHRPPARTGNRGEFNAAAAMRPRGDRDHPR